jgi:hypothetical protein
MKARLATKISEYLTVTLKSGEIIDIGEFPKGTNFDNLPGEYQWKALEEVFGEIVSFGFHGIYDTPSGKLEPGCLYWNESYPKNMYWDNQEGPYLMAVLPNGNHWCIDSRASNCTLPEDRFHRCWCRHGEVPDITVDKNGITCSAGAGSIQSGDYHGFLRNGEFT